LVEGRVKVGGKCFCWSGGGGVCSMYRYK